MLLNCRHFFSKNRYFFSQRLYKLPKMQLNELYNFLEYENKIRNEKNSHKIIDQFKNNLSQKYIEHYYSTTCRAFSVIIRCKSSKQILNDLRQFLGLRFIHLKKLNLQKLQFYEISQIISFLLSCYFLLERIEIPQVEIIQYLITSIISKYYSTIKQKNSKSLINIIVCTRYAQLMRSSSYGKMIRILEDQIKNISLSLFKIAQILKFLLRLKIIDAIQEQRNLLVSINTNIIEYDTFNNIDNRNRINMFLKMGSIKNKTKHLFFKWDNSVIDLLTKQITSQLGSLNSQQIFILVSFEMNRIPKSLLLETIWKTIFYNIQRNQFYPGWITNLFTSIKPQHLRLMFKYDQQWQQKFVKLFDQYIYKNQNYLNGLSMPYILRLLLTRKSLKKQNLLLIQQQYIESKQIFITTNHLKILQLKIKQIIYNIICLSDLYYGFHPKIINKLHQIQSLTQQFNSKYILGKFRIIFSFLQQNIQSYNLQISKQKIFYLKKNSQIFDHYFSNSVIFQLFKLGVKLLRLKKKYKALLNLLRKGVENQILPQIFLFKIIIKIDMPVIYYQELMIILQEVLKSSDSILTKFITTIENDIQDHEYHATENNISILIMYCKKHKHYDVLMNIYLSPLMLGHIFTIEKLRIQLLEDIAMIFSIYPKQCQFIIWNTVNLTKQYITSLQVSKKIIQIILKFPITNFDLINFIIEVTYKKYMIPFKNQLLFHQNLQLPVNLSILSKAINSDVWIPQKPKYDIIRIQRMIQTMTFQKKIVLLSQMNLNCSEQIDNLIVESLVKSICSSNYKQDIIIQLKCGFRIIEKATKIWSFQNNQQIYILVFKLMLNSIQYYFQQFSILLELFLLVIHNRWYIPGLQQIKIQNFIDSQMNVDNSSVILAISSYPSLKNQNILFRNFSNQAKFFYNQTYCLSVLRIYCLIEQPQKNCTQNIIEFVQQFLKYSTIAQEIVLYLSQALPQLKKDLKDHIKQIKYTYKRDNLVELYNQWQKQFINIFTGDSVLNNKQQIIVKYIKLKQNNPNIIVQFIEIV